ncbi:MAG: Na/Pi cotransporter family protein [Clostridiales bacterium]|jgi:phosphate:Na+ symporter|nr:Na/Pi cotransporter family protein [Clostridiales bacterium]
MTYINFFGFLGGLGFFLFGMTVMADGLQAIADSRMKKLLEVLTTNKLYGVLVGALVTMVIQSSSATTVMVVGFVNAGLMNLTQAVGVIMGANIGTTITAWLVSMAEWSKDLLPYVLAPLAVAAGAFLLLFTKNNKVKQIGNIVIGFGILFIGMTQMSTSVSPLREVQAFRDAFVLFGKNPILGLLLGTGITAIIQSSSASVSILQALALSGLIPWNAAVYIIMGQNIGTCVTAIISSIGASRNAKSAAYIHLLFNIAGSLIFSIVAIIYFTFINVSHGETLISVTEISIVHTLFNVTNTILLYPFSNNLISIVEKINKEKPAKKFVTNINLTHLDDRVLNTPSLAIQSCVKEITNLGTYVLESLELSKDAMIDKDKDKKDLIYTREKMIDSLEQEIVMYLVKISKTNITKEEYNIIASLFKISNDFERIGDHCENIAELIDTMMEENAYFSEKAISEIKDVLDTAIVCCSTAVNSLATASKEEANKVVIYEQKIDDMEKELRKSHLERLTNGDCSITGGVLFLDTLTNIERISDHSLNVAQAVLSNDF